MRALIFATLSSLALCAHASSPDMGVSGFKVGMTPDQVISQLARAGNQVKRYHKDAAITSELREPTTGSVVYLRADFNRDRKNPGLWNLALSVRQDAATLSMWRSVAKKRFGSPSLTQNRDGHFNETFCISESLIVNVQGYETGSSGALTLQNDNGDPGFCRGVRATKEHLTTFYSLENLSVRSSTAIQAESVPAATRPAPAPTPAPAPAPTSTAAAPATASRAAPDINQMHRELYNSDPVYQRKTDEISAYASGATPETKRKNQRTYRQIPDVECLTPYEIGRRRSGFSHYLVQNTCSRVVVVSIFCNAEPVTRGLSLKPMEEFILGSNVPSKCKYEVPY